MFLMEDMTRELDQSATRERVPPGFDGKLTLVKVESGLHEKDDGEHNGQGQIGNGRWISEGLPGNEDEYRGTHEDEAKPTKKV